MSSEKLDQAKSRLEERLRQARSDSNQARQELSSAIAGEALGEITTQEIDEIRARLAESQQELDEIPGALVVLNALIEQARDRDSKQQDIEDAQANRSSYFKVRQHIISNPDDYERQPGRDLNSFAVRCDQAVGCYLLPKPPMKYREESRQLLIAAEGYSRRYAKSGPFEFTTTIQP